MYDFCFTYPYAALLAVGGAMGYIKGSTASFYGGVGSGVILFMLAHISLQKYRQGKLWKLGTGLSLVLSLVLSAMMYFRYMKTGKVFPPLVVFAVTSSMSLFYAWSLGWGPEPKKKTAT